MRYRYFFRAFLKYTQNSLKYLIQNMIHQVIQIYHSMLNVVLWIYCYCMSFLCFFFFNKYEDLIRKYSFHLFLNLIYQWAKVLNPVVQKFCYFRVNKYSIHFLCLYWFNYGIVNFFIDFFWLIQRIKNFSNFI